MMEVLSVFSSCYYQAGWTPLHWASEKGHEDVIGILLDKGGVPFIDVKDIVVSYVIVKALLQVLYGIYSTRGVVKKAIQHEAQVKLSAVWLLRLHLDCCKFHMAQVNGALTNLQ